MRAAPHAHAAPLPDSDDEEEICPLCCETLDLTDKNFFPCPCGYQVCLYCWNHIKSDLNGLCPACRTPYRDNPHDFAPVDRDELIRKKQEMKEKKKRERQERKERTLGAGGQTTAHEEAKALAAAHAGDRSALRHQRVVQRNLVYVIGLSPSLANEETLRKGEYFGQYGKIVKIAVNRVSPQGIDAKGPGGASASAYVTFAHKEDASAAIHAVDNFMWDGRVIRASFGTTKYCNTYIRGGTCTNPDCLFLHEPGNKDDTVTKEEIQQWQTKGLPGGADMALKVVVGQGGPSGTGRKPANPIFPPPRFNPPTRSLSVPRPTQGAPLASGASATANMVAGGNPWQSVSLANPSSPLISMRSQSDVLPSSAFSTPTAASLLFSNQAPSKDSALTPAVPPSPGVVRSQSSGAASSVDSSAATGSTRTSSPGEGVRAGISSSISASCLPPQPQGASLPKQSTGGADGNRSTASLLQQPLASGGPLPSSPFPAVIQPPPGMESNALSLGSTSTHPVGTRSSSENTTSTSTRAASSQATGAALADLPTTPHRGGSKQTTEAPRVPPPPGVTLDSLLSSPSLFSPRPAPSSFTGPPSLPALSGGPWSSTTTPNEASQPVDIGGLFPSGGGGGGDGAGEALLKQLATPGSSTPSGMLIDAPNATHADSPSNPASLLSGGIFSNIWGPSGPANPTHSQVPAALFSNAGSNTTWDNKNGVASSSASTAGGPGGDRGTSNTGFSSTLFPFLPHVGSGGDKSQTSPPCPQSQVSADVFNPFALSESLAKAIGMTLPDAPDSLAAQARMGLTGGGGGASATPARDGGFHKTSSRYSFAHTGEVEGAGMMGAPQQHTHRQAPFSALGPQPSGHRNGVPPSSAVSAAIPSVTAASGGNRLFGGSVATTGGGERQIDPSLQSGMAMLQQLLPNVNLTYGDMLPQECWCPASSSVAGSGPSGAARRGYASIDSMGAGTGAAVGNDKTSIWS